MGLRVQDKIEKLIDKHMHSVGPYDATNLAHITETSFAGASRLSLSTISSEELWRRSDRLDSVAPEVRV
jgi:prolyl-tRNA synthetase